MTEVGNRPQALLLDAGDTLLFLDPQAVADALAQHGHQVEPTAVQEAVHPAKRRYQQALSDGMNHEGGWSILVRAVLEQVGIADARARELLPALRRIHDDFYFWRRVPPELPAALVRAREAGLRLGVISNSEGRASHVLQRVGLRGHFELVVDSHLEGVNKPDPEIFERALHRMGVAPQHAMYAGDIPEVDVRGAENAGMRGVLIDAFDDYAGRTDLQRFESVAQLVEHLLRLDAPTSET